MTEIFLKSMYICIHYYIHLTFLYCRNRRKVVRSLNNLFGSKVQERRAKIQIGTFSNLMYWWEGKDVSLCNLSPPDFPTNK